MIPSDSNPTSCLALENSAMLELGPPLTNDIMMTASLDTGTLLDE